MKLWIHHRASYSLAVTNGLIAWGYPIMIEIMGKVSRRLEGNKLACHLDTQQTTDANLVPRCWQPVRKGTNGGVTKAGLLAAAAAGSVIGLTFVVVGFLTTKCTYDVALKQLFVVPLSTLAGLCGSVIDSLLGAALQFSGFCTVRNKVC